MLVANMVLVSVDLSAEQIDPANALLPADGLSFFDYLGTMVEDDGQWVDPLALTEAEVPEAITGADQESIPLEQTEQLEDAQ